MGKRKLGWVTLPIIAGTLLAGAAVTPAYAAEGAVSGRVDTGGLVLNVRTGPSTGTARKATLPDRSRIKIVCQVAGQKITGDVRTTRMWNRLPDGRYVSDAYVTRALPPPRCDRPVGQVQPPAEAGEPARTPSATGWVSPIPGAVGSGFRTKDRPSHDGVDIAARKGTKIVAAAAGAVIVAECNASTDDCDVDGSPKVRGCGWYVEVAHAGAVVTRYCHLVRRPAVKVGDQVEAGQLLGYVGSSGNSSGPHLHFEVHTNAPLANHENAVNPVTFLKTKGIRFE